MFLFVGAVGQIGTEISFLTQRIISSILTKPDFFYLNGNDGSEKQGLDYTLNKWNTYWEVNSSVHHVI